MKRARWAKLGFCLITLGCFDQREPSGVRRHDMRLVLQATVAAPGEVVDVAVSYVRQPAQRVLITTAQFVASDTGLRRLGMSVDLETCLNDAQRVVLTNNGCAVVIDATLRDSLGLTLDSTMVGPIDVRPAMTAVAPPIVLQVPSDLIVLSGATQLGFAGRNTLMPVVVRVLDRASKVIAGRTVSVTRWTAGSPTIATAVTNTAGDASVFFPVGQTPDSVRIVAQAGGRLVTQTARVTPIRLARQRLAAGFRYSCWLQSSGGPLCWGDNAAGALGNRSTFVDSLPVTVGGSVVFESIAAAGSAQPGVGATCGLTVTGETYCWGLNVRQSLGVQSADQCASQTIVSACAKEPLLVATAERFAMIDVGSATGFNANEGYLSRVCAVKADGVAMCWGSNSSGELGDNTRTDRGSPAHVATALRFVHISTGTSSTCGVAATGEIYCWGSNFYGELGNGAATSLVPVRIASTRLFREVDVGYYTVCAIELSGDAYCWGLNWDPRVNVPGQSPTLVTGGLKFTTVKLGYKAACGLTTAGQAYCWGARTVAGQLGDGRANLWSYTTTPVPVMGQLTFTALTGSGSGHFCGETIQGQVFCWGAGDFGQLGNGSRLHAPSPVQLNSARSASGAAVRLIPIPAPDAFWSRGAILQPFVTTPWEMDNPVVGVQVVDAAGLGVRGVPVQFSVVAGGAAIIGASTIATDASGFARLNTRLGPTAGTNVYRATAAGVPALDLTIQGVVPGTATALRCFAGSCIWTVGVTGISNGALRVVAVDDGNLPVAGAQVTFTAKRPLGVVTPTLPLTITTNADGAAGPTSFTAGTVAGRDTAIIASISGRPTSATALLMNVTGEAPITLFFNTTPFAPRAGQTFQPISVFAYDRFGNTSFIPVSVTLSIAAGPPGATISGALTQTTTNGFTTFTNVRLSPAGVGYALRATAPGLTSALTAAFTVVP